MSAEKLISLLSLNYRQTWAAKKIIEIFKSIPATKILAALLVVAELLCMIIFDTPTTPRGEALDLTGYSLVFSDDFDGDTLDTEKWFYRGNGVRRGGYMSSDQIFIRDGNCVLKGEYLEDGKFGEGWYGGMIALKEKYLRGYFEVRCICNSDPDFWSAFWIQADDPYTPEVSKGGIGGAELDIFEAMSQDLTFGKNSVTSTIHCAGMEGDTSGELNSAVLGKFKGNNIYQEYNTYGLKWTEEEYIFYINGVETVRSSWGDGVSEVPETVILSLCVPSEFTNEKYVISEFVVDYVKIWQ